MSAPPKGQAPAAIDPYRAMFPIGIGFALTGAAVWPLLALGRVPYPGPLHVTLMIQGFEQCFILGFLLTAMPAFTHGPRCRPWELATAVTLMILLAAGALAGLPVLTQSAFLLSLALVLTAGIRRIAGGAQLPPEEFQFVAFGLLLGVAGGAMMLAAALGANLALPPRFPERLVSLGMVLSLVMGLGSLLVPTFAGMRDPLVIPGIAAPHERHGRRWLYRALIAVFALAFAAELAGQARLGMGLRAAAVTTLGLWVWKLARLPRRDVPGFTLWGAGWMIMLGPWGAALWPLHATAALHVTFIGGFAMLTLGIGTRVIVSHGRHPLELERRILDPWIIGGLLAALAFRLRAEAAPEHAAHALAGSALFAIIAWLVWALRVAPLIVRTRTPR